MDNRPDSFELFVAGGAPEADEAAARAIADELAGVPGVSTRPLSERVEAEGAKALDGNMLGLLVSIGSSGALLPVVVGAIRDWLGRQRGTTAIRIKKGDLELEWNGSTPPEEIEALVKRLAATA